MRRGYYLVSNRRFVLVTITNSLGLADLDIPPHRNLLCISYSSLRIDLMLIFHLWTVPKCALSEALIVGWS